MTAFAPPPDPVFQYLLEEAVIGRVPVWAIVVSADSVVPRDPDFHPESHPEGSAVVAAIIREWQAGRPVQPWVYPRRDLFVASDDYFALAAIRCGKPATLACQCLGEPDDRRVHSRVGPIPRQQVRAMLNIQPKDPA